MRTILIILLACLSLGAYAHTRLICYSGNKVIYSGKGGDWDYDHGVFFMREANDKNIVASNGPCILTTDIMSKKNDQ
jgi:hypothetical protein